MLQKGMSGLVLEAACTRTPFLAHELYTLFWFHSYENCMYKNCRSVILIRPSSILVHWYIWSAIVIRSSFLVLHWKIWSVIVIRWSFLHLNWRFFSVKIEGFFFFFYLPFFPCSILCWDMLDDHQHSTLMVSFTFFWHDVLLFYHFLYQ